MLTNEKRRALHDFIAGTVVVRTNTEEGGAQDAPLNASSADAPPASVSRSLGIGSPCLLNGDSSYEQSRLSGSLSRWVVAWLLTTLLSMGCRWATCIEKRP